MATPPNNPLDAPVDALNDQTAQMASKAAHEHWSNSFKGMKEDVDKATSSVGDLNKNLTALGNAANDVRKLKKEVKDVAREFQRSGKNLGYKQQLETIEQLKRTISSLPNKTKEAERAIDSMGKALAKSASGAKLEFKEMAEMAGRVESAMEGMANSMSHVKLTPLTKQFRGLHDIFGGNKFTRRIENFARTAAKGHEVDDLRDEHRQNVKNYKQGNITKNLTARLKRMGIKDDVIPMEKDEEGKLTGNIDSGKLKELIAGKKEVGSGMTGWLRDLKPRRAIEAEAGDFNAMNAAGGVGRWKGGVGAGLLDTGMGAASSVMKFAGEAALPLAIVTSIGSLAKAAYDKTVASNLEIEKNLGGGGIFSGSGSAGDDLSAVRHNLTPDKLFDPLNVTYEKRMNVAKSLQESGLSLADLASPKDVAFTKDDPNHDSRMAGFNQISQVAFGSARLTGLDESSATKEIVKLLETYHLSLASTDSFFQKLSKDTRAAGISTSKYLSILDGVTDGFDSVAKSVDSVTAMMRLLGKTGIDSAEGMKKGLDALIGAKSRNLKDQAFMGVMYKQDQSEGGSALKDLVDESKDNMDTQVGHVVDALKPFQKLHPEDFAGLDLHKAGDLQRAQQMAGLDKNSVGVSQADKLTLDGTIKSAKSAALNYQMNDDFYQGKSTVVDWGAQRQMVNTNPINQMNDNLMAFTFAAQLASRDGKKESADSMMRDPQKMLDVIATNGALMTQMFDNLHVTQDSVMTLGGIRSTAISNAANEAMNPNGSTTHEQYKIFAKAITDQHLKERGKDDKDDAQFVRDAGSSILAQALNNFPDAYKLLLKDELAQFSHMLEQGQADKDQQLAAATRTSAEVFANAFQHLFNMVADPLNALLGLQNGGSDAVARAAETTTLRNDLESKNMENIVTYLTTRQKEIEAVKDHKRDALQPEYTNNNQNLNIIAVAKKEMTANDLDSGTIRRIHAAVLAVDNHAVQDSLDYQSKKQVEDGKTSNPVADAASGSAINTQGADKTAVGTPAGPSSYQTTNNVGVNVLHEVGSGPSSDTHRHGEASTTGPVPGDWNYNVGGKP